MNTIVRLKDAHTTINDERFEAGTIGEVLKTLDGRFVVCELLKPGFAGRVLVVSPDDCEIVDPEKMLLLY